MRNKQIKFYHNKQSISALILRRSFWLIYNNHSGLKSMMNKSERTKITPQSED